VKFPGATHRVVTCQTAAEPRAATTAALRILEQLGVQLHPQKTRIVHVRNGFEFLGYKIKRGQRWLRLSHGKIRSGIQVGALYAYPREKSIRHFMDQVRALTKRRVPLQTKELIEQLNPLLRGWGHHYKRAHVRVSSTSSTVGLCGAFGRIGSNDGETAGGDTFQQRSCTASMSLLPDRRSLAVSAINCIAWTARNACGRTSHPRGQAPVIRSSCHRCVATAPDEMQRLARNPRFPASKERLERP
jgi:hypothetical protein